MTAPANTSPVDPSKDPTAPKINPTVIGAAAALGVPGLGLAITNFVQDGHISIGAIVLAVAGLAGGLFHSANTRNAFQTWLQSEPGRLAAAHPELAALRAEADALRSDLTKTASDTKKALDTAAGAASTATGIDLATPMADLEDRLVGFVDDAKAELGAGNTHAGNLFNTLATDVASLKAGAVSAGIGSGQPPADPPAGQPAPAADTPPGTLPPGAIPDTPPPAAATATVAVGPPPTVPATAAPTA